MVPSKRGLAASPHFEPRLRNALVTLPQERRDALPTFDVIETSPAIDSSAASPHDWQRLADLAKARQSGYKGIVILHGTDTLAWTASSLAFQLQGIGIPIVVTGAMRPLGSDGSDALDNIEAALRFASCPELQEVAVCFAGKLTRATRTRKQHTHALDAFDSPNLAPIGELVDHHPVIKPSRTLAAQGRPAPPTAADYQTLHPSAVARIVLWPGIDAKLVRQWLSNAHVRGALLEVWGGGNIPDDSALANTLAEASASGRLLAAISQCPKGEISIGAYAASHSLENANVLSGGDMTPEAAMTKLFHLLALPISHEARRHRFMASLAGER
ncbi:asparaginase [Aidingimonas halophila]|uniref:Asparaginase n=2 Tax=Aidingimonas halophila TaxID=574349 RepID=A0A1H3BAC5_9GAMM|nr:L-asparaginase 1 [Aidingimonas halophila]SDX38886.1 asparaginase [Aidingimonas halophila]